MVGQWIILTSFTKNKQKYPQFTIYVMCGLELCDHFMYNRLKDPPYLFLEYLENLLDLRPHPIYYY